MTSDERLQILNRHAPDSRGAFILYWMQNAQRPDDNPALDYALRVAHSARLPVRVYFGLTPDFPEARRRHYRFMIEGLRETLAAFSRRGIAFTGHIGAPVPGLLRAARRARMVVVDRGYLRVQREWRQQAADALTCPLHQIEGDVIVPVELASPRQEYAAATFRPKIHRLLPHFLVPPDPPPEPLPGSAPEGPSPEEFLGQADRLLNRMPDDGELQPASYIGGPGEATRRLNRFLAESFRHYADDRNDPAQSHQSGLSPYLHFGQISPLRVALSVRDAGGRNADAFLEELIVRRELAANYVFYQPAYDRFEGLPEWARTQLTRHARDRRDPLYSLADLESGRTHDPYWNAAQAEMRRTGKMHGYLRMYWGKQILAWSPTPEEAFRRALALNNRYLLDGRDPNGFAGVAWCFGLHDRPWAQRPIFGSVRSMTASGLERKFDMAPYLERHPPLETIPSPKHPARKGAHRKVSP